MKPLHFSVLQGYFSLNSFEVEPHGSPQSGFQVILNEVYSRLNLSFDKKI